MSKRLPLIAGLFSAAAVIQIMKMRGRQANARRWAGTRPGLALVTGASSGIGAVFARHLARQGYNLALVARREDLLRALAAELEQQYGVRVQVIPTDLSRAEDLERLAIQAAALPDLDLLVNNAGFGVGGQFAEVEVERNMQMVRVNLVAPVRLSHAVLPGMIRRGRGGIINVSSVASFLPATGNHSYGATKAYLNFMSESLSTELAGTGVRVQALCPGYTRSEFHATYADFDSTIPRLLWLDADQVVADSLRGLREGQLYVVPGAIYKLAVFLLRLPGMSPLVRLGERLLRFRRFSTIRNA